MELVLQWKMKAKFGKVARNRQNLGKKGLALKEKYTKQKHENI
jgi:hypothetical protein